VQVDSLHESSLSSNKSDVRLDTLTTQYKAAFAAVNVSFDIHSYVHVHLLAIHWLWFFHYYFFYFESADE